MEAEAKALFPGRTDISDNLISFAKTDAVRDYWYAQFKNKTQESIEDIEKIASKCAPTNPIESFFHYSDNDIWVDGFKEGYKNK